MRRAILSILLTVLAWPASGWALDFLHGEIETVDSAARIMTVRADQETGGGQLIEVTLPEAVAEEPNPSGGQLPGCIVVGRHVRVWGQGNRNDGVAFRAEEVRGCGMVACGDPTGVRSRLYRNRAGKPMGKMCQ
ncbi:hypothetical protein [Desulfopila aestuarii]|uniref:Uncharacterized protein n=1 Tax=Desulfopila aestuarii DSM 18488 TaxID=1121416 RepID=A0A1M7Y726_9BACT|nr:hypothetical protein [Desulfopila aestuarii]SHO48443.1 hypothetical protein SAMN02745220_02301 [Desulfopila aestuarii DSM 18488]